MTTVGTGKYTYTVTQNWAKLPSGETFAMVSAVAKNRELERFLVGPTAVKCDAAGLVYIVDSCRYRLQIYRRVY